MSCPWLEIAVNEVSLTNISVFLPLDTIFASVSVVANLLCLATLIRTTSLHTPSNILIAGLCFSDLLIGLLQQPMLLSYLFIIRTRQLHSTSHLMVAFVVSQTCIGLSFTYTTIINIDRYLAICHPFKYYAKATHRTHLRTIFATFVIWLLYTLFDRLLLWQTMMQVLRSTYAALALASILATNIEVMKVINRQNTAMRSILTIPSNRTSRCHIQRQFTERNKAYTCAIVTTVYLFCGIPILAIFLYIIRSGTLCWGSYQIFVATLWANFLVTLNSFMNPVIYCIRVKTIRKAIKKLVCGNNDVSSFNQSNE